MASLSALGGDKPAAPATGVAKAAPAKCSKCAHAPCRCGFSPSYYTHYRKPVRRTTCDRPVATHWSRPHVSRHAARPSHVSSAPESNRVTVPSPRPPRVVPAVTPRVVHGYVPSSRSRCTTHRHARPFTSSLVSGARRARVVPRPTVRQSLGFDPHHSWSQRLATQHAYRRR